MEAEHPSLRSEEQGCWPWGWKKGPGARAAGNHRGQPPGAGKAEEEATPPEGAWPCPHLDFSLGKPF